jgi:hypothetical protein
LPLLRALARAGGPHLQRLLGIHQATRTVIYEAPEGTALGPGPLAAASAPRMLAMLGRALAPLHAEGFAHGALGQGAVLLEGGEPIVLIAGRVDPNHLGDPALDVTALISLVIELVAPPPALREFLLRISARTGAELADAVSPVLE